MIPTNDMIGKDIVMQTKDGIEHKGFLYGILYNSEKIIKHIALKENDKIVLIMKEDII